MGDRDCRPDQRTCHLYRIGLVDRWGRKPTLTLGFLVMAAGMGVLGTMMHIGIHSPSAQYFAIAMLLMFIVGFAMECRSADLGTVLRNSAAERPRFWHHLLHCHQLDCQHDRWRNVPDHAQHAG
ncbi:galactose-proton symporter [Escherichia coli]|uniref:Galactose-proton symporter n=1 Tax=Escherichia coli TaxID=562 RepID=A0A2X1NJ25_ECOLX|nr:galactose-proton symporter [Escherichia coli]